MKITIDDVRYVARLARLELADSEAERMTSQLARILEYVDTLNTLDTEGVPPTSHVLEVTNAFREDVIRPSLPREEALANAPRHNTESFVVPRVI